MTKSKTTILDSTRTNLQILIILDLNQPSHYKYIMTYPDPVEIVDRIRHSLSTIRINQLIEFDPADLADIIYNGAWWDYSDPQQVVSELVAMDLAGLTSFVEDFCID